MKHICSVPAIFVFLICLQPVSAYTFLEHSSTADSVRLVLNTQKSTVGIVALDVAASTVSNIYSAGFDLDFNSSVLQWAGAFTHDPDGYEKGDFFDSSAMYAIGNEIDVNGIPNRNKLVVGAIGDPSNPKSGSGTIMTIKFKVIGKGSSSVSFSNNNLIKPDMSFTSSSWYEGTFMADSGPIPPTEEDNPPVVSLVTLDQTVFSSRDVTLACTASDDYGLANMALYTTITGSWQPYQTVIPGDRFWLQGFELANLNEGTYKWNCKATDSKGQEAFGQADYFFTIQLPVHSTPPQRSNGQPSGNLNYTTVTISLQTDEMATCRYADVPGFSFDAMLHNFTSTGGTSHSMNAALATGYLYKYYVKCRDSYGIANTDDYLISFSMGTVPSDTQPPVITNDMITGLIPATMPYAALAVRTDEDALCKYASQGGLVFGSMAAFANTYFTNHTELISGLREGTQYDYYVKCSDAMGNTNPSDTLVSFYVCYEIDDNCDRSVSLNEMNKFMSRWQLNSRDVILPRLIKSLSLWKSGGA